MTTVTTKKCSKCKEIKVLSEFYKNQGYCKVCHKQYCKQYRVENKDYFEKYRATGRQSAVDAIRKHTFFLQLIEEGLISDTQLALEAINLLYKSCQSSRCRGGKEEGTYANVENHYPNNEHMVRSLLTTAPYFNWNEWLKQTTIWLENDRNNGLRPTLDRIDSDGHYCDSNIRVKSLTLNVKQASAIPAKAIVFDANTNLIIDRLSFDSKAECIEGLKELGLKVNSRNLQFDNFDIQRFGDYDVLLQTNKVNFENDLNIQDGTLCFTDTGALVRAYIHDGTVLVQKSEIIFVDDLSEIS